MRTLRLIAAAAALCLCAACSRPEPEEIVTAMLDEIADKSYTRALRYCGPRVWEAYSNHIDLTQLHARMCEATTFTVMPGVTSGDTAYVDAEVLFEMKGYDTHAVPIRFDVTYGKRWLVQDAWRIGHEGRVQENILDHLPRSLY
jgi:hypothetical protein